MLVDFPLEELRKYKPARTSENDFDEFWDETLEISKKEALNVELQEIDHYVKDINTYKLYYDGFGEPGLEDFTLLLKRQVRFLLLYGFQDMGIISMKLVFTSAGYY